MPLRVARKIFPLPVFGSTSRTSAGALGLPNARMFASDAETALENEEQAAGGLAFSPGIVR
jgi:hypothetical protein